MPLTGGSGRGGNEPKDKSDDGERETMNDKIRWYKRFINFLKETRAELKKVTWPSKSEVTSTTIVVVIATIFFGFYLFFMDIIFSFVIKNIKAVLG